MGAGWKQELDGLLREVEGRGVVEVRDVRA
jgi:hypothetical protein